MSSRRFTRLTNGFCKKLENHAAAVSLYVAHYNMCRVHGALRDHASGRTRDRRRIWSIGDLIDAALAVPGSPSLPRRTAAAVPGNRWRTGILRSRLMAAGKRDLAR